MRAMVVLLVMAAFGGTRSASAGDDSHVARARLAVRGTADVPEIACMLSGRFELGGRLRTFSVYVGGRRCASTDPESTAVLRVTVDTEGVVVEAEANDIAQADLQQVADTTMRAISRTLEERANPPAPAPLVIERVVPAPGTTPTWHPKTGFLIAGPCVFVGGYVSAVINAISAPTVASGDNGAGWLYVPIIGPFVAAGLILGQQSSSVDNSLLVAAGVTDVIVGVVEAAGVAMTVIGLVGSRKAPTPPRVTWSLLGVAGRF